MKSALILVIFVLCASVPLRSDPAVESFRKTIQPILTQYCYDCHGDGMKKGNMAFDQFKSDAELLGNHDLWWNVLKNLRAGLMPPQNKARPSEEEKQQINHWIKRTVFQENPADPDPGRVTLRRLNRTEYRNTIRDLMGVDFNTEEEFPSDDTGYGFDNIGDVLSVSPLLLEKYVNAAETIVRKAVPSVGRVIRTNVIAGSEFRTAEGKKNERWSFYEAAQLKKPFSTKESGGYEVVLNLEILGSFGFDPGRCEIVVKLDDQTKLRKEYTWENGRKLRFEYTENWSEAREHELSLDLTPLVPLDQKKNSVDLKVASLEIIGPLDRARWIATPNYNRFFSRPEPPQTAAERQQYACEVLKNFATKAFRRPVDDSTIDRLLAMIDLSPGQSFEAAISRAMVAVLSSPRFIFRSESTLPASKDAPYALIDEFALASRLSYFLWSTMPDDQLFDLAQKGELRARLDEQVKRMVADERSDAFVSSFAGQWLQSRDVEGVSVNLRAILNLRSRGNIQFEQPIRRAMRKETELVFSHIMRGDRNLSEFIASDYTFLNAKLAEHYGIKDVEGAELRLVKLPPDSPRGGILGQGAVLTVTSNPTRTSPVKRGLFLLENILGTPPPPPPDNIPPLEDSKSAAKSQNPTVRQMMEIHRDKPLCASCHARMDPLGLALENFNAIGMWREKENDNDIDTSGKLVTGEPFKDVRDLKKIILTTHLQDFYQCLTEKLLTYALGRGLEYYDVQTVDRIVADIQKTGGQFSALLNGIIRSAPFQKQRVAPDLTADSSIKPDSKFVKNEAKP